MTDAVLHATPRSVAIAGAVPFVAAVFALGHPALFAAALFAGIAMFYAWTWVVGHALNRRIDAPQRPPITRFRISIAFCAIYVAIFLLSTSGDGPALIALQPGLFFGIHLLAMLATVYALRFVALNLSMAESAAHLESSAPGTTALSLFSIAGIVPVQKRVNRLFDSE